MPTKGRLVSTLKEIFVLSGFLAFFLRLDPGFEIYIGNVKVFDFSHHGINDEVRCVAVRNGVMLFELASWENKILN